MGNNLYYLQRDDIKEALKVIGDAFLNDPKICFYLPDPNTRMEISYYLWEFLLKDGIKHGDVIAPSKNLEGISIWLPPGNEYISFWRAIRNGVLKIVRKFGSVKIKLMNRTTKITESLHKKHIKKPHWHFSLLAVDPKLQGKGYASRMIKPMIKDIESKGYQIYLDTNNPNNVFFYQHFGFKVKEKLIIPDTSITHWCMLR